jgi:hypothetical protein
VIDVLDEMLRTLLRNEVPDLKVPAANAIAAGQVRFDPPDNAFGDYLTTLTVNTPAGAVLAPALDVYLADIRENRHLRSNEWGRRITDTGAFDEPPPTRIDLHYLVTAWVPGKPSATSEPATDEQLLLYEVAAALLAAAPLNASRIYANPAGAGVPAPLQDLDLPTAVLPVDGFPKLAEFWGAMGRTARWKPAIYFVVTLPVFYPEFQAGPIVTTKFTTLLQDTGASETFVQIGGVVRTSAGAAVPHAWVRLETTSGLSLAVTESDDLGRFDFDGLRMGRYVVRARKQGINQPATATLDVPSPAGGYDVRFP